MKLIATLVVVLIFAALGSPALAGNVLVWDNDRDHVYPDPGPGTEVAIMESLEANQFEYDFCTQLPGDLTPYDAIFIPIGWYFC